MSWTPPNAAAAPINAYRAHVNKKFKLSLSTTPQLHDWSIQQNPEFWVDLYEYLQIVPPLPAGVKRAYDPALPISSVPPFFEGHRMNYAENLLTAHHAKEDAVALYGVREEGVAPEEKVTWKQLRERVRLAASALAKLDLKQGDRVAALVSNSVWAVVIFLACASKGIIFSSINPDLGSEGCIARLKQITPKLIFADGDTTYKGKRSSVIPKVDAILASLDNEPRVFIIPVAQPATKYPTISEFVKLADSQKLVFERVSFIHPLIIVYSSGTTGTPKCIVHQHGIVLNLKKVSMLQSSLSTKDVILQYTSTSWIMWSIQCGHLAAGATLVLYDGSPMYPDTRNLLRLLEKYRVSYFGTSPRYILELEMANVSPKDDFDLSGLNTVNTTGAPFSIDQHHYFYRAFPYHTRLNNTAGGTDTATTLIGGSPTETIHFGEMTIGKIDVGLLTTAALGIDCDVADSVTGESIKHTGEAGEFVIRKPFPSMPPFFFADPSGKAYKASYFERFDKVDVWAQSDWVSWNPKTGGWTMHGRSDGVLNPSGIRFGSGEVYAIVEGPPLNSIIQDCLCVGRRRPGDKDEEVFLFVNMVPGKKWDGATEDRVRQAIASGLSRRHVPRFMVEVDDIPVTINGKKVEIAVKHLISGKEIKVSSTVANPETLKSFAKYRDYEGPRRQKL